MVKMSKLLCVGPFILIIAGVFCHSPAPAAQLKSLQSGTATIGNGSSSATVTITAVTTGKAFLVFGIDLNDAVPADGQISGQITDSTTLTFSRTGTSSAVVIAWYVAEFVSGVSVQRGTATLNASPKNVAITAVNTAKSFPLITLRTTGSSYGSNDFVRARITGSTDLELTVNATSTSLVAEWQVIEYTDASVQAGDLSFGAGDSSKTATIAGIDTGKSWLIYNYKCPSGTTADIGQKLVRGVITDGTTLMFDRHDTGITLDLTWFVVTFTDGTTVQGGSQAFTATETQKDVTISSVDTTWSLAAGGYLMRGGRSPYSSDDNPGVGWFTLELTGAADLRITRGLHGSVTADVGWFVVQFVASATSVSLISSSASARADGILFEWRTGSEMNNLGFHVWRERGGEAIRITPSLISGSALLWADGLASDAGHSYRFLDPEGIASDRYWLEDVDLNGTRTVHGPAAVEARPADGAGVAGGAPVARVDAARAAGSRQVPGSSPLLSERRRATAARVAADRPGIRRTARPPSPSPVARQEQLDLAARPALKITVREEGWYRLRGSELAAAGFDPAVDSRFLQLFADGRPIPISTTGRPGRRLGRGDAVEFYGVGLDTPSTDGRVYWLEAGRTGGARIGYAAGSRPRRTASSSFPFTVEHRDRSTYFAALLNGDAANFFGEVVAADPVEVTLDVPHLDPAMAGEGRLRVALQGVTKVSHAVTVFLNGTEVRNLEFEGQDLRADEFPVSPARLVEGENRIVLAARGGETDVSLVDSIRITYRHTWQADGDALRFELPAGVSATVRGFTGPGIRVMDVTDPDAVRQVTGEVHRDGKGYAVRLWVSGPNSRVLCAFAEGQAASPADVEMNRPSRWHQGLKGAWIAMIAHRTFLESLEPLAKLRKSQGYAVALIDVADLYDEFTFGARSPDALRGFLRTVPVPPRSVLLVGDSSFDPRDFLGQGDFDFVPTKLVDTAFLETASDDWFADFDGDGIPRIPVGRLPVRTAEEARTVVAKIAGYSRGTGGEAWTREVLLVADRNDRFDFEETARDLEQLMPADRVVRKIFIGQSDPQAARTDLLSSLDSGQLLVNYVGHGSVEIWSKAGILTSGDAPSLANGPRLPFVVAMNCLNGYFHDLYTESLAEALLKAEGGGAVAVWTSSGLTEPGGQAEMDRALLRVLFEGDGRTLGEAVREAKASVADKDIRRTWILFGDPSTRLK